MKVTQSSGIGGKWLDKKTLQNGSRAKIKTEATEAASQQGGTQLVAKLLVEGMNEALNVSINSPSKNALIHAFGDETTNWIDKVLTVQTESVIVGGKRGTALYLIPEGYKMSEDAGGYVVITKEGDQPSQDNGVDYPTEDINPDDIPF